MASSFLKPFAGLLAASILVLNLCLITPAHAAESDCSTEPSAAVAQARKALKANNPQKDRLALECLVEAVASLDTKLEGLRNGLVPFSGPVKASVFHFLPTKGAQP